MSECVECRRNREKELAEFVKKVAEGARYFDEDDCGSWEYVTDPGAIAVVGSLFKRMVYTCNGNSMAVEIHVHDARAFPGYEDAPGGSMYDPGEPRYFWAGAATADTADGIRLFFKICRADPASPNPEDMYDAEIRGLDGALVGLLDELDRSGIRLPPESFTDPDALLSGLAKAAAIAGFTRPPGGRPTVPADNKQRAAEFQHSPCKCGRPRLARNRRKNNS